ISLEGICRLPRTFALVLNARARAWESKHLPEGSRCATRSMRSELPPGGEAQKRPIDGLQERIDRPTSGLDRPLYRRIPSSANNPELRLATSKLIGGFPAVMHREFSEDAVDVILDRR